MSRRRDLTADERADALEAERIKEKHRLAVQADELFPGLGEVFERQAAGATADLELRKIGRATR